MKRSTTIIRVCLFALVAGCLSVPAPDEAAPGSGCQAQGNAFVTFTNASATNLTYDALFDGKVLATVAPQVTTSSYTVPDSVGHTVQFNVAGTSTVACASQFVTLFVCTTTNYACHV